MSDFNGGVGEPQQYWQQPVSGPAYGVPAAPNQPAPNQLTPYQPNPYQQQGYPPGGYQQGYPAGAYLPQFDAYGRPFSDKTKTVAGLLGILLGGFGAGRFYTGHTGMAVAQLLVTLFTCGLGHFWGLIDGIMLLVNGGTDAQGRVLRS